MFIHHIVVAASLLLSATNEQTYEAVIRYYGGDNRHVTTVAKDWYNARDQIRGIYCGGNDCIVEGPWPKR